MYLTIKKLKILCIRSYTSDIQCFSMYSTVSWTEESISRIINEETVIGLKLFIIFHEFSVIALVYLMYLVIHPTSPHPPITIFTIDDAIRVPWI